jgi:predicted DsbA family dithiol-disulfide isomerase
MALVDVTYYTDPACPWSWAQEPELRRLEVQFGDGLEFTYVMGGLAREFAPSGGQVREWLDAADASGMPVDVRLWLDAPPASSYPACMAVKAAAEQGLDGALLRLLREGFAFERRKLDTTDALVGEARKVPGLNVQRFGVDLGSHAIVEAFGADLDRARELGGGERPPLPSVEFRGPGARTCVLGPGGDWVAAAEQAGAVPAPGGAPTPEQALVRWGRLATPEVAAACGLPGPRAPEELWRLASAWRVRVERRPGGEVWSGA